MQFIEEKNDLFNYTGKAWLAHCISADFGMGKGIVCEFNKRYNLKNYMMNHFVQNNWYGKGYCLPVEQFKVFNLVTKKKYYQKPTYSTLKHALIEMKKYAMLHGIHTIAMPLIGCGLDGLSWEIVRKIIQDYFKNTDIKIIVCKL